MPLMHVHISRNGRVRLISTAGIIARIVKHRSTNTVAVYNLGTSTILVGGPAVTMFPGEHVWEVREGRLFAIEFWNPVKIDGVSLPCKIWAPMSYEIGWWATK